MTSRRARAAAGSGLLLLAAGAGGVARADHAPSIALVPGLVVVSATSERGGSDYEVVRSVHAADDETVTIAMRRRAAETPAAGSVAGPVEELYVERIVRREDLRAATRMNAFFSTEDPASFPGSTATQTSAKVLQALRSGSPTPFVFGTTTDSPPTAISSRKYFRGSLTAVRRESEPFSVLLDGKRSTVPALHARGTLEVDGDSGVAEFWWLDQADNPLTLRWSFKGDTVQVVRIDTAPGPVERASTVAPGLASEACRAELHGVYFDTGSADLLPESDGTIAHVAELLRTTPDWHVTVEGHTDGVGTEAANLELSKRRAEAVRAALIANGVGADRLAARGFGETRPVESNDALEGRARNRRVELARRCS